MATEERIDSALGRVLRTVRRDSGLTMAQLAEKAGISQPHLSQMENGKVSPSINTLYRLANALGITPQDLLPPSTVSDLLVVRRGEVDLTPIGEQNRAALARVLVGSPGRDLQVQEIVVAPGDDLGGWFDHEGEEFLYLLEGSLILEVQGHDAAHLAVGDSAWYESRVPHRWVSESAGTVRILAVSGGAGRQTDPTHAP